MKGFTIIQIKDTCPENKLKNLKDSSFITQSFHRDSGEKLDGGEKLENSSEIYP